MAKYRSTGSFKTIVALHPNGAAIGVYSADGQTIDHIFFIDIADQTQPLAHWPEPNGVHYWPESEEVQYWFELPVVQALAQILTVYGYLISDPKNWVSLLNAAREQLRAETLIDLRDLGGIFTGNSILDRQAVSREIQQAKRA